SCVCGRSNGLSHGGASWCHPRTTNGVRRSWERSTMKLRTLMAAAALAALASAPALAAKKDNTVRFAYDQVLENIDPYFNNVRLGVMMSHTVWDTLIYRDPDTNEYKPNLATSWKWIDDLTLE